MVGAAAGDACWPSLLKQQPPTPSQQTADAVAAEAAVAETVVADVVVGEPKVLLKGRVKVSNEPGASPPPTVAGGCDVGNCGRAQNSHEPQG